MHKKAEPSDPAFLQLNPFIVFYILIFLRTSASPIRPRPRMSNAADSGRGWIEGQSLKLTLTEIQLTTEHARKQQS